MTTLPKPLIRTLIKNRCSAGLLAVSLGAFGTLAIAPANALAMQDQGQTQNDGSFWTRFVPSEDTRLIFVSSSEGNDANSGLTPRRPVKSLSRAYDLLRDGYPDWMLLKRGDVWYERFPNWNKDGRAEDEKMIVGAYGESDDRPQIRPDGGEAALRSLGSNPVVHVAFVGFHLEPNGRAADENGIGISWLQSCNDIHFEDLYIDGFKDNIVLQAYPADNTLENIHINGCVVVDSWSNSGHSQGLYVSGADGLLVENSVFDHNGWNLDMGAEPTIFRHNIYIQNGNSDIAFTNNIIANASSHGLQMRSGGIVTNNLFISNPIALLMGGGTNPEEEGVTGIVHNNLVMHGRDISVNLPRGIGLSASNIREATIDSNYFHLSNAGYNHDAIQIGGDRDLMTTNITLTNNTILGWHGSFKIREPAPGQSIGNIVIEHNTIYRDLRPDGPGDSFDMPLLTVFDSWQNLLTIQNNVYRYYGIHDRPFEVGSSNVHPDDWGSQVELTATTIPESSPPPVLDLGLYLQTVGRSGDWQDFLQEARRLSRVSTNDAFMANSVIDWFIYNLNQHSITQHRTPE